MGGACINSSRPRLLGVFLRLKSHLAGEEQGQASRVERASTLEPRRLCRALALVQWQYNSGKYVTHAELSFHICKANR